jgi:hypothetical protein
MKKVLIISGIIVGVIVLLAVIGYLFLTREPDLSQFEHLKEPQISTKENQKMLVVEAKGDPNIVGEKAFGLLFKFYYQTEGTPKVTGQHAPCAICNACS